MYLEFLGYFCAIIVQIYILLVLYDNIILDEKNKNYDLLLYIKNCLFIISSFILIYITSHLYFKNSLINTEINYIVLFISFVVLFYWSYFKISWMPGLLHN